MELVYSANDGAEWESFDQATQTYTLLTVGDGLVSQIPALVVSTAAGLLVSKAGVVGSADKAMFRQLSHYPKALGLVSFLLTCLSLLPGMPMLPFIGLALLTGGASYRIQRNQKQVQLAEEEALIEEAQAPSEEPISTALTIDAID